MLTVTSSQNINCLDILTDRYLRENGGFNLCLIDVGQNTYDISVMQLAVSATSVVANSMKSLIRNEATC